MFAQSLVVPRNFALAISSAHLSEASIKIHVNEMSLCIQNQLKIMVQAFYLTFLQNGFGLVEILVEILQELITSIWSCGIDLHDGIFHHFGYESFELLHRALITAVAPNQNPWLGNNLHWLGDGRSRLKLPRRVLITKSPRIAKIDVEMVFGQIGGYIEEHGLVQQCLAQTIVMLEIFGISPRVKGPLVLLGIAVGNQISLGRCCVGGGGYFVVFFSGLDDDREEALLPTT